MGTNKGIVFETSSTYSVFLTADGHFQKGVPLLPSVRVGEEAFFQPYKAVSKSEKVCKIAWRAPIVTMVAAMFILFSVLIPSQSPVSAFIQIDINPSIELGINDNGTVFAFKGLNQDGVEIKRDISFWRGKSLSWVLSEIVKQTDSMVGDTNEVGVTTIFKDVSNHEKLAKVIHSAIADSASDFSAKNQKVQVTEASVAERESAINEGKSVRKYHLDRQKDNELKQQKFNNTDKRELNTKEKMDTPGKILKEDKRIYEKKSIKNNDKQFPINEKSKKIETPKTNKTEINKSKNNLKQSENTKNEQKKTINSKQDAKISENASRKEQKIKTKDKKNSEPTEKKKNENQPDKDNKGK